MTAKTKPVPWLGRAERYAAARKLTARALARLGVAPVAAPVGTAVLAYVGMTVAELEQLLILATLDATRDNKSLAATLLGLSRRSLYNKLAEYGIAVAARPAKSPRRRRDQK